MAATQSDNRKSANVDREAPGAAPTHHLSEELLLDYAAGVTDEAVGVLIATHLTLCPVCRARADQLDALGGVMMDRLTPSPLSEDAFDRLMARLDADAPGDDAPLRHDIDMRAPGGGRDGRGGDDDALMSGGGASDAVLPRVLQRYVPARVEDIDWTPIGLGVRRFDLSITGRSRATMLYVPAGRAVPQHTHEGNEYVLVLQGAFTDCCGHFGRGDVGIADSDLDHRPVAELGQDCICLAVTDGPLRLTGLLGRAFNRFVKF
ncbi:ChrR family anti-sigma-E factor [Marivibrio halodurans]|uniref:ChrR family anti-sigma-E factor n=1 Tax=Marivibrio halodurans TaxID=2039722 RepID=A0A8J7V200_9PROT|nr:ChrR family anti-sigma-E factor [Marivibrio halodurans]MBP5856347.1 ChrR family anti-sigma-E factor [Marivibrio halodurans]